MTPNVSVIVCTHSPRRDYLGRTLEGLRIQTLDRFRWELVVIDNASKEPLAGWIDLAWHPHARLIEESVLGQMPARLRGVAESVGDLLVFVDDDNVLSANYLERGIAISEQWPQLGVWGGQQHPEYEEPPPGELALTSVIWRSGRLPATFGPSCPGVTELFRGGGMFFRKAVASKWHAAVQQSPTRKRLGRTGSSLASGVGDEDTDLAMTAFDVGLGTGIFHSLILTHLIPARRLTEDYLVSLVEAQEFSDLMLQAARGASVTFRKPSFLGSLRRWYQRSGTKDRLRRSFHRRSRSWRDRALDVLRGQPG